MIPTTDHRIALPAQVIIDVDDLSPDGLRFHHPRWPITMIIAMEVVTKDTVEPLRIGKVDIQRRHTEPSPDMVVFPDRLDETLPLLW